MSPRRLGQHFLVDRSIAGKIVHSAHIETTETIVEVGPGRGAITGLIAERAKNLLLIEIDETLSHNLEKKYVDNPFVFVHHGDARSINLDEILPVLGLGRYKVIANLPYYAATVIIRNFLQCSDPPKTMIMMLQKEVADQMQAEPGKMTILSITTQTYAKVETLFNVGPKAFSPPPKVNSSVIKITPLAKPAITVDCLSYFFDFVKLAFKSPRKQLHNSLSNGLNIEVDIAKSISDKAGICSTRRPGTLSLFEWQHLYESWILC